MQDQASLESYMFYRHRRGQLDRRPAGRRETLHASDGYPLGLAIFDPEPGVPFRGVVVIASATGVRRTYYAPFAAWLAARGHRVVTFDYRGIGDSRPPRLPSFDTSLVEWATLDLASVIRFAKDLDPSGKIALIGHSVGGQLLGLLPDDAADALERIVMVGSQSGDYRLWPTATDRALYGALWYAVVPGITSALGYLPGALGIGEDLPGGVAREWARWCRTPGYMVGGDDGDRRRDGYRRLRVPLLAFGFDDDDYAPPAAVSALLALYENASITRRQISRDEARVGHFGFFRDRFTSTLWDEAASFLVPSG